LGKSSSSHVAIIAPKLSSNKSAVANVAQTEANTSGTFNVGNNNSSARQLALASNSAPKHVRAPTDARALIAPAAVQHAAVIPIMPKASNGSKNSDAWRNNTA